MTVWGFFNPIIQFVTSLMSHPDAAVLKSFRLFYSGKRIDVKKQKIQLQGIGIYVFFKTVLIQSCHNFSQIKPNLII